MTEPVHDPSLAPGEAPPDGGVALCLSGGGYRAMLFHLGVLIRLNELGRLPTLTRVSSVSGGSITAGLLGLRWRALKFRADGVADNFFPLIVEPLRAFARRTIDRPAILIGLLPGPAASRRIAAAYRKHLFGDATLQDLPADGEGPRFVINATNVRSGDLFRFSRPYAADYAVGRIVRPRLALADVVAASSAFPPFLSPTVLSLAGAEWEDDGRPRDERSASAVLTDGGVYDNLGLETAWKRCRTLIVSDAGQKLAAEAAPAKLWGRHTLRVLGMIDNQVRSLRKRELIEAFKAGERAGVYIGIRSALAGYPVADPLPVEPARAAAIAALPTRLKRIDDDTQERLLDWGYAVCDAGVRAHMGAPEQHVPAARFPYPQGV